MNRLDRALGIVLHLRSGERCSAAMLAARFEVSARTIYRDLDLLSALGVPVYAERGRGGGIRLMPGYFLPPVTFTVGEAVSLVLAVTLLRGLGGRPFAGELDTAARKLLAAVPNDLRRIMAEADRRVAFESVPEDAFHPERPTPTAADDDDPGPERVGETVTTFLRALLDRRTVHVRYRSPYRATATAATVRPLGLLWDRDRWYLVGAAEGDPVAPRLWRADRVERITVSDRSTGDEPQFDVRDLRGRRWLEAAMADWIGEAPVQIRLSPIQAARLRRDWYFGRARFDAEPNGTVRMIYGEDDREAVFALLRWLGPGAELVEPTAWRDAFRADLAAMLADHMPPAVVRGAAPPPR